MQFNQYLRRVLGLRSGFFAILIALQWTPQVCNAKLIARRDPLDGALDAAIIAILRQQTPGVFRIEEAFLGPVNAGQTLELPGFSLVVPNFSTFIAGVERTEPINADTRILVFLKPARGDQKRAPRYGDWAIAGFGNCYFDTQNPKDLTEFHRFAASALALRHSWEAARDIRDEGKRIEALWPFLWDHNGSCFDATLAELRNIGPAAGDYIAQQFVSMTYLQRSRFLWDTSTYGSSRLHRAVVDDLLKQQQLWAQLLSHHSGSATFEQISRAQRMRYNPRRAEDLEADHADDISGEMYYGLSGLAKFEDRSDLPFIQETARWALKYRFQQTDEAALDAFRMMPACENVPIIRAIWEAYSKSPFRWNERQSYEVMRALETHPYPEAIPVMAQFVNVSFANEIARNFLMKMTGVDFGGDQRAWMRWWAANQKQLLPQP